MRMRRRRDGAPRGAIAILLVCLVMLMAVPISTGQRWNADRPDRHRDRLPGPPFESPLGSIEDLDLRYPSGDFWPWGPIRPPQRRRRPSTTTPPTTSMTTSQSTTTVNPARLVDAVGAPVNCKCPATQEFNPVCGTNGATYNSPVKLRCAQRCGYEVQLAHYGNCQRMVAQK